MADPTPMTLTTAGLNALVDAQSGATEAIRVVEVGLTEMAFDPAPTLTALPGEFKRLGSVSGQSVSETIIHMTAQDSSTDIYDVRGLALYLEDGTLFASYGQETPIFGKVSVVVFLLALDIAFSGNVGGDIAFGDALFLNPPATETVAGVAKIATNALADAGADDLTIMSPKKVKRRFDALVVAATQAVAGIAKLATNALADAGVDDSTIMTPAMVKRMIDRALHRKIMMFSGAIAEIDEGWQLCDGTNDTPDLTGCFVIGAGGDYAVGDTGGTDQHNHGGATGGHALTIAEMPSHDHPNGVADQIATAFVYGTIPASTPDNMNNDSDDGTMQGMTGPRGGGAAHEHPIAAANHLPPYYALAYIMKV